MSKEQLRSFYYPHDPLETAFDNSYVEVKDGKKVRQYFPSMTKQEFVADCDIHNILAEFKVTGQIKHLAANAAAGVYADLTNLPDYQEALNTVAIGQAAFDSLPSKLRARFENDPAKFLAFMEDPANQDEIIKLGLAVDNREANSPPLPPSAVPPAAAEPPKKPENNGG